MDGLHREERWVLVLLEDSSTDTHTRKSVLQQVSESLLNLSVSIAPTDTQKQVRLCFLGLRGPNVTFSCPWNTIQTSDHAASLLENAVKSFFTLPDVNTSKLSSAREALKRDEFVKGALLHISEERAKNQRHHELSILWSVLQRRNVADYTPNDFLIQGMFTAASNLDLLRHTTVGLFDIMQPPHASDPLSETNLRTLCNQLVAMEISVRNVVNMNQYFNATTLWSGGIQFKAQGSRSVFLNGLQISSSASFKTRNAWLDREDFVASLRYVDALIVTHVVNVSDLATYGYLLCPSRYTVECVDQYVYQKAYQFLQTLQLAASRGESLAMFLVANETIGSKSSNSGKSRKPLFILYTQDSKVWIQQRASESVLLQILNRIKLATASTATDQIKLTPSCPNIEQVFDSLKDQQEVSLDSPPVPQKLRKGRVGPASSKKKGKQQHMLEQMDGEAKQSTDAQKDNKISSTLSSRIVGSLELQILHSLQPSGVPGSLAGSSQGSALGVRRTTGLAKANPYKADTKLSSLNPMRHAPNRALNYPPHSAASKHSKRLTTQNYQNQAARKLGVMQSSINTIVQTESMSSTTTINAQGRTSKPSHTFSGVHRRTGIQLHTNQTDVDGVSLRRRNNASLFDGETRKLQRVTQNTMATIMNAPPTPATVVQTPIPGRANRIVHDPPKRKNSVYNHTGGLLDQPLQFDGSESDSTTIQLAGVRKRNRLKLRARAPVYSEFPRVLSKSRRIDNEQEADEAMLANADKGHPPPPPLVTASSPVLKYDPSIARASATPSPTLVQVGTTSPTAVNHGIAMLESPTSRTGSPTRERTQRNIISSGSQVTGVLAPVPGSATSLTSPAPGGDQLNDQLHRIWGSSDKQKGSRRGLHWPSGSTRAVHTLHAGNNGVASQRNKHTDSSRRTGPAAQRSLSHSSNTNHAMESDSAVIESMVRQQLGRMLPQHVSQDSRKMNPLVSSTASIVLSFYTLLPGGLPKNLNQEELVEKIRNACKSVVKESMPKTEKLGMISDDGVSVGTITPPRVHREC